MIRSLATDLDMLPRLKKPQKGNDTETEALGNTVVTKTENPRNTSRYINKAKNPQRRNKSETEAPLNVDVLNNVESQSKYSPHLTAELLDKARNTYGVLTPRGFPISNKRQCTKDADTNESDEYVANNEEAWDSLDFVRASEACKVMLWYHFIESSWLLHDNFDRGYRPGSDYPEIIDLTLGLGNEWAALFEVYTVDDFTRISRDLQARFLLFRTYI